MKFNLIHIIDFAVERWEITRTDIATKYLYCDNTKLSRFFYGNKTDLTKIYTMLFDVKNKESIAHSKDESESDLLAALKDFIEKAGFKSELESEWGTDTDYTTFVKAMLRVANQKPPRKKRLSPYSDKLEEEIRSAFRKVFILCDVYAIVNFPNSHTQAKFDYYVDMIECEISTRFKMYKKEIIYSKIMEFTARLEVYVDSLTNNDSYEALSSSDYSASRFEYDPNYERLGALFYQICKGNLFPTFSFHIISEDCSDDVREAFIPPPPGEPWIEMKDEDVSDIKAHVDAT